MEEKLQELDRNHTWDMVTLPLDITEVCCRWIDLNSAFIIKNTYSKYKTLKIEEQ